MFKRRLLTVLLFLSAVYMLPAAVFIIEETGFVLDLPEGWQVMDFSEDKYTFNDFTGDAYLQIKTYPGEAYSSAEEMFDSIGQTLHASGEGEAFDYNGRSGLLASIEFEGGAWLFSGWALFADGEDFDFLILSFASSEKSALLNDYLLSAMDSFSLSFYNSPGSGPVSQFYQQSFGKPDYAEASVEIGGKKVQWRYDRNALETAQVIIEREARILQDFRPGTPEADAAWERFYRMVYRDNYGRLEYPSSLVLDALSVPKNAENGSRAAAEGVLEWVQGFEYVRTGGSDLISPIRAAVEQVGDCDSRALLFAIVLNHYGINSAIMVSSVYSHAMALADIPGAGARMEFAGRSYLAAETTEKVDIGLIASDMADPSNWLVIQFLE